MESQIRPPKRKPQKPSIQTSETPKLENVPGEETVSAYTTLNNDVDIVSPHGNDIPKIEEQGLNTDVQSALDDDVLFLVNLPAINPPPESEILDAKRNEISFIVTVGLFNTTEQTLIIVVNAVNLQEINHNPLHVSPRTRKQILPEQLLFKCPDELRAIRYIITVPPLLGRILYENTETGHTREISEFEQNDIENGRISYEHTTAMPELKTNDSFIFDVAADKANHSFDQKFDIEISVSSGGLLRFLPVVSTQTCFSAI